MPLISLRVPTIDPYLPGARWQDEVLRALRATRLVVVVCTPDSVARPWVNFEAGAGLALQRKVIPVCCLGLTKAGLPMPLSMFQALDGASLKDVEALVAALAAAVDLRAPSIDIEAVAALLSTRSAAVEAADPAFEAWLKLAVALPEQAKGQTQQGRVSILRFSGVTDLVTFNGIPDLIKGKSIEIVVEIGGTYFGSADFYASGDVATRIIDGMLKSTPPREWRLAVRCAGAVKKFETSMVLDFDKVQGYGQRE